MKLLQLLKTLTAAANEATSVEDALRVALREICAYANWPVGHAYRVSKTGSNLLVAMNLWHCIDPDAYTNLIQATEETPLRIGEGLPGRVVATGQPAWILDVTKDKNFPRNRRHELEVRSAFAFPVFVKKVPVAVLEFFCPEEVEPEVRLLEAMGYVGAQFGHVFERDQILSELRASEERLRQLNITLEKRVEARTSQLSAVNKELEQFAFIASHDLQEPLRAIAGFSQLLAQKYKGKIDEQADEYLSFIVGGITEMRTLIHDLLAYSRTANRDVEFGMVDGETLIQKVLALLTDAISRNNAAITRDPLPNIRGDETQLGQLFQNLLANAIKFRGAEPPRIHIGVEPRGEHCVFSIRDNGIGISPNYIESIFMPFKRLHTKSKYPGSGIGLAICKKIVEHHQGRIWVESKEGEGSTFFFTLWEAN